MGGRDSLPQERCPHLPLIQSRLSPYPPPHVALGRLGPSSAVCAQKGPRVGCMALACRAQILSLEGVLGSPSTNLVVAPPVPGSGQGGGDSEAGPVGPFCPLSSPYLDNSPLTGPSCLCPKATPSPSSLAQCLLPGTG